jgi:hypothetical protein
MVGRDRPVRVRSAARIANSPKTHQTGDATSWNHNGDIGQGSGRSRVAVCPGQECSFSGVEGESVWPRVVELQAGSFRSFGTRLLSSGTHLAGGRMTGDAPRHSY